jgi:AbrB family looped-hinge helix DNA binding protein
MRVTANGRVTIPAQIRERTGLVPGTEVELIVVDDGVRIVKARKPMTAERAAEAIERLRRAGAHMTMTTDEIMELTRGET